MRVLICAYACIKNPDKRLGERGGEGVLGWNIVQQASLYNKIWALTHCDNRKLIEERLIVEPILNAKFCYISLPRWLDFLRSVHGGIQIYTYLWQIKAYFVAKKLHKEIKFDVFHHITYANDWMASFIGAFLPIPYVRGPGGASPKIPKGFLKDYSLKDRFEEWLRFLGILIFRLDPFFIIGQKRAKNILVCNKESFDLIPKKWKRKTILFPVTGVSYDELNSISKKFKYNNKFLVIIVGRIIRIKGFDLSIRAFKLFLDKIPGAELIVLGSGPDELFCKKLANKLKIENNIIFENKWMTRKELLEKMALSDIFLFPSLRDGGGNVVVEAMALAKPVICLDIGGPGFHINDKCGIKIKPVFPEQVINDMAVALEKLYTDKELRKKLGKAGRERAEKNYSWNKLGERLNTIYKNALNGN